MLYVNCISHKSVAPFNVPFSFHCRIDFNAPRAKRDYEFNENIYLLKLLSPIYASVAQANVSIQRRWGEKKFKIEQRKSKKHKEKISQSSSAVWDFVNYFHVVYHISLLRCCRFVPARTSSPLKSVRRSQFAQEIMHSL